MDHHLKEKAEKGKNVVIFTLYSYKAPETVFAKYLLIRLDLACPLPGNTDTKLEKLTWNNKNTSVRWKVKIWKTQHPLQTTPFSITCMTSYDTNEMMKS